jgi:predicted dienelactone hydrolase
MFSLTPPPGRRLLARFGIALAGLAAMAGAAAAQVGMARLALDDLPVTLVYPTAQAGTRQGFGPFQITVAMAAVPSPGQRRLVVLSHGTGGSPLADHDLAATLAGAGFFVAQPSHRGDNNTDSSAAGAESWTARPGEVSRVIDALAGHPAWAPLLRLDRVGVHGMSAGGVTGLAMAGAQWRMLNLIRHCLAHADADPGFCFNGLPTAEAQAARRASYERARNVPEAFLAADIRRLRGGRAPEEGDVRLDPRIAAVTLSVPVAAIFSAESLARIQIPVGLVRAGRDTLLQPGFHTAHVLRQCGACTLLADLPGAGHMDLLSPWPPGVAQAVAAMQAAGGLPEPGFDPAERAAAFRAIAAFFVRQLDP